PPATWKNSLKNDFEIPVFEAHPSIKAIKETLYTKGALYASMSGSGSTVFGIFNKSVDLAAFTEKNYFTKIIN
ncbi:MAG: 4-(cytidine 5'-diphospho)-2-C-methyl-D-erythritol kinase, partial [Ferruginibacter sp.]